MNGRKLTAILFGLGAGAATLYLADPKNGQRRRADLANGAKRVLKKVAHEGEKALRDSQHRLSGVAAQLWPSSATGLPSDQVIEVRIRSRLGRVTSHIRRIHVLCDRGTATLWGSVPEEELGLVVSAVENTPGVTGIIDHLESCRAEDVAATHSLRDARDQMRLDWSPSKRLWVGATGTALALYGLKRKDVAGTALSLLGAGMAVRSTMRQHLRASLAIGESNPGFEIEKTIRINAPFPTCMSSGRIRKTIPRSFLTSPGSSGWEKTCIAGPSMGPVEYRLDGKA